MSNTKQLTLPITGMTCANCVATVERNLKKLDGVNTAMVNRTGMLFGLSLVWFAYSYINDSFYDATSRSEAALAKATD